VKKQMAFVSFLPVGIALGFTFLFFPVWHQYEVPDAASTMQTFGQASTSILPRQLHVVVWNAHKLADPRWAPDLASIAKSADLILLQEAYIVGGRLDELLLLPNIRWDYAASFRYTKTAATTGVATGAQAMPTAVTYQRSSGREPLIRTPKIAILSRYSIAGSTQPLLVVNVHAHLAAFPPAYETQLAALSAQIRAHTGPVIWGGDFNSWAPGNQKLLKKLALEAGLQPVAFAPDTRSTLFGSPLDHIFVRGFEVLSSQVHSDLQSSDHKALSCTLKLLEVN
jgi:endonuclease/exonuclease/phosphatase (EEP) superfamily protein YafD